MKVRTMLRWMLCCFILFWFVVFSSAVGCVPKPTTQPRFKAGDIAYHKLDGQKVVIIENRRSNGYYECRTLRSGKAQPWDNPLYACFSFKGVELMTKEEAKRAGYFSDTN